MILSCFDCGLSQEFKITKKYSLLFLEKGSENFKYFCINHSKNTFDSLKCACGDGKHKNLDYDKNL